MNGWVPRYKFLLIRPGEIPPADGPNRDRFLDANGACALHVAQSALIDLATVVPAHLYHRVLALAEGANSANGGTAQREQEWADLVRLAPGAAWIETAQIAGAGARAALLALNFLEDRPGREDAHRLVHTLGAIRGAFRGCHIWAQDGQAWTDCPVRLHRFRFGISLEAVTEWGCSVCLERFEKCTHIPGDVYRVTAARLGGGCNVCVEKSCGHIEGVAYEAMCRPIALRILDGASAIVDRPRYPEARVQAATLGIVDDAKLMAAAEGGNLHCTQCLFPCQGLLTSDMLQGIPGADRLLSLRELRGR